MTEPESILVPSGGPGSFVLIESLRIRFSGGVKAQAGFVVAGCVSGDLHLGGARFACRPMRPGLPGIGAENLGAFWSTRAA